MALKVGELFASFGIDSSGVESSLKGIEAQCNSIGSSVAGLGVGMSAALTAPITKAFKDTYNAGVGFNSQMSRVFAIRGLNDEATFNISGGIYDGVDAMKALEQEALRMAAQSKFSTEESGKAFEYMAMAGWDVNNMLSGLEPIMNLAIASGNELGSVSDIVTDAMTAFGMSADGVTRVLKDGKFVDVNNVEHFSDVLAATSTNANTNVAIMGETFKYVAAQAGAMGYSIDDMAIGIGLMANAGVKGSQAGTSLKNILTNMAKPTKQVAAAIDKLGIRLDDGNGNMLSFRDIMKDLRQGFGGLKISSEELTKQSAELDAKLANGSITEEEYAEQTAELMERAYGAEGAMKAEAAAALAGKYGMSGLLSIVSASEEDFNKLINAVDNATGATEQMADTMSDNAEGDVMRLSSAINVLETDFWRLVDSGFRDVIQNTTELINKFMALDDATKEDVIRFAALAAVSGPVLIAAGKLIQAIPGITSAIMSLATPLGVTTLGLALFAVAAVDKNNTVGNAFEAMSKKAADKLYELSDNIKTETPHISSRMGDLITSLNNGVNDLLPALATAGTSALSSFMTAITDNADGITALGTSIITGIANGISNSLPTLIPKGITMVATIAVSLIKSIPILVATAGTMMSNFVKGIEKTNWVTVGSNILNAIEEAISGLTGIFDTWFTEASAHVTTLDWAGIGTKMIDLILTSTVNITEQVSTFIKKIVNGLKTYTGWTSLAASFAVIAKKLIGGIAGQIPNLSTEIASIITAIGDAMTGEGANNFLEAFRLLGSSILLSITSALPKIEQGAETIITAVAGMLNGIDWTKAAETASTLGSALIGVIANGIKSASGIAVTIVEAIGSMFGEEGIATKLTAAAGTIAVKLITAITDNIPKVTDGAVNILKSLGDMLSSDSSDAFLNTAVTVAGNIIGAIVSAIPSVASGAVSLIGAIGDMLFGDDGNIVDGAATAVQTLVDSLATAIAGGFTALAASGTSSSLASVAVNLINGMTDALPTLFQAGGSVISAGAKIANSIMASIVQSLADIKASGLATSISTAATSLLKNLLEGVGNFGSNDDVKAFMRNLGDGLRSAASMIGNVIGDILAFIFSPEGLTAIWNAGKAIAELLWNGIESVISGMGEFILGIFHIDSDTLTEGSKQLETDISYMMQAAFGGDTSGHEFVTDGAENLATYFKDHFLDQLEWSGQTADQMKGPIRDYFTKAVNKAIDEGLIGADWGLRATALADNDEFWQSISDAFVSSQKSGKKFNLFDFIFDQAESDESAQKANEVLEKYGIVLSDSAQDTADTVSKTVSDTATLIDQLGNDFVKNGYTTAVTEGTKPAQDAAIDAGNTIVQSVMLTMSEENGKKLGSNFMTGLHNALIDEMTIAALIAAATDIGTSVNDNTNSTMGYDAAYILGYSFDQGLAQGIYDGMSAVIDAAIAVASAAKNGASDYLKIGSPSRLARDEIGLMFDAGIAEGLADGIRFVSEAATDVARSMHESYLVGDSSYGTIDTSRQSANRTAQATVKAQDENKETRYEIIGRAIADRLIESGVLESDFIIDGVVAGHKLSGPVSNSISRKSNETIAGRSLQGVLTT